MVERQLKREKRLGIVEKEKDSLIIASYGTFSTGINIRNINNIVLPLLQTKSGLAVDWAWT